jgi:hypothetical protein
MGLRSVALGHAYPAVVAAATWQMQRGTNFTRPSPLEGECAEHLLEFVPGARNSPRTAQQPPPLLSASLEHTLAGTWLRFAPTIRSILMTIGQSVRHPWMPAYRGKQVVSR